jgi:hypothetical protein
VAVVLLATAAPPATSLTLPSAPPLRQSDNVELLGNIPGSAAGMVFKDDHAFVTGFATGLTVYDISTPESPTPVGALPLPHFENEDVDLCGDTLLIANDRADEDLGAVLYVIDISEPATPTLASALPLGARLDGRGAGHIANFVTADCTQVWVDGGDEVDVIDLTDPAAPVYVGDFVSAASESEAFRVSHDTELDDKGVAWSVGGGGAAGYRPNPDDPTKPTLFASTNAEGTNPSPEWNDFILHNSQRRGDTLLVTEEDYIDTDAEPNPGSCNGQGRFETWRIRPGAGAMTPIDSWQTELNAEDSKAPVTINCSSHWFDERGGIAAVAWYEQGTRLLDVRNPGNIRQIGYYLPVNGSTWAAYWAPNADDIVYTADVYRGIDVLRVKGAGRPEEAPTQTAPILSEWFGLTQGVEGFTPSPVFGWACALPTT